MLATCAPAGDITSDLLPAVRRGDVAVKPAVERLSGERVRFVDGSVESIDRIVDATGYRISVPSHSTGCDPYADRRLLQSDLGRATGRGRRRTRPSLPRKSREVTVMVGVVLVGAFLILVEPLSYFFGVDSRLTAKRDRDSWPARPRRWRA